MIFRFGTWIPLDAFRAKWGEDKKVKILSLVNLRMAYKDPMTALNYKPFQ